MAIRLGVVVNPRSRYLKQNPDAVGRLRTQLAGGARGVLAESHDLDGVDAIAAGFRDEGVDAVAIVGGDGTAGVMARAVVDAYADAPPPPFALLRGGTMNTVANALGVPRGRPERQLAALLARTADGALPPAALRPTLEVEGRLGFLFGTGVFYTFLEQYYRAGRGDPSAATAVATISHAAASVLVRGRFARRIVTPVVAEVRWDGGVLPERPYLGLCAGTVREVGLGFEAFHLADRFHGAFHFLAIHGSPTAIVRDLPRVWLGLGLRPDSGDDLIAREVTIRARDGELRYMLDGDLYATREPLTLKVGPRVPILLG